MPGIIIDIGTGDGKFVEKVAKAHPDRLVIGIDPQAKPLKKISGKLDKKSKGGLPNALYVLAHIEDLPPELNNQANQVFINFPWASLLQGIILDQKDTWANIKRICQNGAVIDLILGYNEKEAQEFGLPLLSLDYIQAEMLPKLFAQGFQGIALRQLDPQELQNYPSTWAKRLGFGQEGRQYYYLRLKVSK